jgi:hypothetical protein
MCVAESRKNSFNDAWICRRRFKRPILYAGEEHSSPRVCILCVGISVSDCPVMIFEVYSSWAQPKGGGP